jgi:hypothetical protein
MTSRVSAAINSSNSTAAPPFEHTNDAAAEGTDSHAFVQIEALARREHNARAGQVDDADHALRFVLAIERRQLANRNDAFEAAILVLGGLLANPAATRDRSRASRGRPGRTGVRTRRRPAAPRPPFASRYAEARESPRHRTPPLHAKASRLGSTPNRPSYRPDRPSR